MGKPVVGEVVILPFPQTDLQRDSYSVPLASGEFEKGRLNVDSFIRPNRLFTVDHHVISYTAAKIKTSKLDEVRAKIRQLFS